VLFVDTLFLVGFLPVVVALFFLLRRVLGHEYIYVYIFVVSCLFYAKWGYFFLALMLFGTVVNFVGGATLVQLGDNRRLVRLVVFTLAEGYNFGSLAYFKYLPALLNIDILRSPNWMDFNAAGTSVIPIGISFYTFQQAVFIADAYGRDPVVAQYLGKMCGWGGQVRAFLRYGAFHCFFPQLVIGPITYLSEFAPQVMRKSFGAFRRIDMEIGLTLFIVGLFKKLVLADSLALIADPVFTGLHGGTTILVWQAWLGTLAYYVQLYFDFSGYSDMALGTARMLGVRLPANFDSPLRSTGIMDFYRRWHMSLTRVIGRFLFAPLSLWGTRKVAHLPRGAATRRLVAGWLPLFVNFGVIALWHGALATFMLFGVIHSAWYILEVEIRSTKMWFAYKRRTSERFRRTAGQVVTFMPLLLTFALFRSEGVADFGRLLISLFRGGDTPVAGIKADAPTLAWIAAAFAIVWLLPNAYEFLRKYRPAIRIWRNPSTTPGLLRFAWRPNLQWAVVVLAIAAACLPFVNRETVFIYMGF
jgi:alginate O-acetyltransferase complex protein AlgI